jgi:hypothetical protein
VPPKMTSSMLAAAQRLCRHFAEHPADGVAYIALAAAVRADDGRDRPCRRSARSCPENDLKPCISRDFRNKLHTSLQRFCGHAGTIRAQVPLLPRRASTPASGTMPVSRPQPRFFSEREPVCVRCWPASFDTHLERRTCTLSRGFSQPSPPFRERIRQERFLRASCGSFRSRTARGTPDATGRATYSFAMPSDACSPSRMTLMPFRAVRKTQAARSRAPPPHRGSGEYTHRRGTGARAACP